MKHWWDVLTVLFTGYEYIDILMLESEKGTKIIWWWHLSLVMVLCPWMIIFLCLTSTLLRYGLYEFTVCDADNNMSEVGSYVALTLYNLCHGLKWFYQDGMPCVTGSMISSIVLLRCSQFWWGSFYICEMCWLWHCDQQLVLLAVSRSSSVDGG